MQNVMTLTWAFVANTVFEYIFVKRNNFNWGVGIFIPQIKGTKNFNYKNTPSTDNDSRVKISTYVSYHMTISLWLVIAFNI